MKRILLLFFCVFPFLTRASIPPEMINIANTCAYEKSTCDKITYQSLMKAPSYIDDNDSSKERTFYIKDNRHIIGYIKSDKRNGFLHDAKFYPLSNTVFLDSNKNYLNEIDYTLISWGYITFNNHKYICANAPFAGIGESGRHQYTRGIYIFNVDEKKRSLYFLAINTLKE